MSQEPSTSSLTLPETSDQEVVKRVEDSRVFSELIVESRVQATRWFVVAFVEFFLIMVLVIAMAYMTPLVKTIPYMVKVDTDSGQVVAKPDFLVFRSMRPSSFNAFPQGFLLRGDPCFLDHSGPLLGLVDQILAKFSLTHLNRIDRFGLEFFDHLR